MARTCIYLTFKGNAEEAFNFYRDVFKTDFTEGPLRMEDMSEMPDMPPLSDNEKKLIMHVSLPILGGHVLMGCDDLDALGRKFIVGTNVSILLELDTREETEQLFETLSKGGEVKMPLKDMFWGDYYGELVDRFGVQWLLDCPKAKTPS